VKDNASILFAAILLLGGGLIIGKTLIHKRSAEPVAESTCQRTRNVEMSPEIRAYIEQKTPNADKVPTVDANLLKQVEDMEKEARLIVSAFDKSKQFIARVDQLERNANEWFKTRDSRLEEGRQNSGQYIIGKAIQKCGQAKPITSVAPPPQATPAQ